MKPDLYTKAVLTVIAIALAAIAVNQYANPKTAVQAQGTFAGVQYSNGSFFDTRTGEVWVYNGCCGLGEGNGKFAGKMKLTKLGQSMSFTP
jgi:hypothetical protein